jgi:antitoxin component YwqK of YwqJK toxin-antitoxin module
MKKMLLSAMICVLSFTNFAQFLNSSDSLIYTDATYKVLYSGTFSVYDLNGKLFRKIKVLNGQLNGGCYWYYPDGQLWANMHYKNNVLHGDQTIYYENGRVKSKEFFLDGVMHGYNVHYYETGQIQQEANLYHGVWQGKYAKYDMSGNMLEGGFVNNNKPIGNWIVQTGTASVCSVSF